MLFLPDNLFLYVIYYIKESRQLNLSYENFINNERYAYVKSIFEKEPDFIRLYNDEVCLEILKVILEFNSRLRELKDQLEACGRFKPFKKKRLKSAIASLKNSQMEYYDENYAIVKLSYENDCFNIALEE
jgi:hypothetical protein